MIICGAVESFELSVHSGMPVTLAFRKLDGRG